MAARLAAILLLGCSSPHITVSARTDCSTCHTAPALTDPAPAPCTPTDHSTYATTCFQCHGTTAWCPADATHDKFDITRASHAGWDCADCHLAITYDPPAVPDPTQITCITCHSHDQGRTDARHLANGRYKYGPATCLAAGCHGDRP